jgi:ABC-type Fe3+-siderophore transport system permease subunit
MVLFIIIIIIIIIIIYLLWYLLRVYGWSDERARALQ